MKEFDLEAAKAGKPVVTRKGTEARIICFDKQFHGETNMVVLLKDKLPSGNYNELIRNYKLDGTSIGKNRNQDLFMATEKNVYYVNIYENYDARLIYKQLFETHEEAYRYAMSHLSEDPKINYITTTKLEWEE